MISLCFLTLVQKVSEAVVLIVCYFLIGAHRVVCNRFKLAMKWL